jgi:hypothetical protein
MMFARRAEFHVRPALAKDVNENAGRQINRDVLTTIASWPAPTGNCVGHEKAPALSRPGLLILRLSV